MSPIPLIARQRALSRIGEIRLGDEKHEGKVGRKLDTFRLTSQHKEILKGAAELYGGEVKPWQSPTGEAWQLITTRSSLPVMVIPGYSLKRAYEKWDGPSKRVRICDGEEEAISGQQCLCNAAGKDECKLLTRLMVLLPETGTSLGWQLSSTGETAADELDLAMKIAEGIAQGRPFVPGTLSITQRKGQLNGQATRFVVPVLGFNPTLVPGELGAQGGSIGQPALPLGYTPIPPTTGNGVSLAEGLEQAATQTAKPPRVPLPDDDVDEDVPVASSSPDSPLGDAPAPTGNTVAASTRDKPATDAQVSKLGVYVGWLRDSDEPKITTEDLYKGVARERGINVVTMTDLTPDAFDTSGVLHWGPLLATLTRAEASALIDALKKSFGEPPKEEK